MKTLMLAVLGVGLAMSTAPSAHARDGCGLGFLARSTAFAILIMCMADLAPSSSVCPDLW
jgi:hypothetical protein